MQKTGWIKKLQDFFKPPLPDYRLEKCFDYKGVRLYKFENPLNMPYSRYCEVMQAVESYSTIRIGHGDLIKGLSDVKEYNARGMQVEVGQIVDLLLAYANQEFNHSILFSMASPLILLEDEDPENPTIETNKRKLELYQADREVRGFFLRMGYTYLMSFSQTSIGHTRIEDFLSNKQMQRVEKVFLKLIISNTLKATKKKETSKSMNSAKGQTQT